MIYLQIFIAFLIPNIIGYGGGPAVIPLIESEVVTRYGWLTTKEYGEVLAIANTLPGPIATKMSGVIGYEVAGWGGAAVAIFATVAPSLMLMIFLVGFLMKHKDHPKVQALSATVRPAIAVLMAGLTFRFVESSYVDSGIIHTIILGAAGIYGIYMKKLHAGWFILVGLVYGALFIR